MYKSSFEAQLQNHKDYSDRKASLGSLPIIDNIEIISKCNLKCPICIPSPKREKYRMSLDEVKYITENNIDLMNGRYIWLHHYGEPLVHTRLIDIIDYLDGSGINTRISTNATILDKKRSEGIIKSGLKEIVFSVDGNSKEDYERIRVGADYDEVISNILEFLRIKGNLKYPVTQVQFVDAYGDPEETAKFIEFWRKTSVDWINIKTPSTRSNQIIDTKLSDRIKSSKSSFDGPCYWLWSTVIILSDGNVVPCCADLNGDLVLGNVFESSIKDIWNSERAVEIRKEHIEGCYTSVPKCSSCPEKKGYGLSFEDKLELEMSRQNDPKEIRSGQHRLIRNG